MTIPWSYGMVDEVLADDPSFVCVQRFYCFKWEAFERDDYDRMADVFAQLPGWLGFDSYQPDGRWGTAYWFGRDEAKVPFLEAWIEIPYLQVVGVVQPAVFADWDASMLTLAVGLPKRILTGWKGTTPAP